MTLQTAVAEMVGDLTRFGPLADRIDGLIDAQVARYRSGASEWMVLPWSDGFYLFSEDSEGQRRGREVVVAFLGPNVVSVESVIEQRLDRDLPPSVTSAGLMRASHLKRVYPGAEAAAEMLTRLEDLVSAVGGRSWHTLEIRPRPSDLLRDFRLALLQKDSDSAQRLLARIPLTGHVSAENLRYLRIEYLAAFGRWAEMRSMPHIGALMLSRRPRAVSESLLRMVWWAEVAVPGYLSAQAAFQERGVLEQFGPLLRSVRVPATLEGRLVCFLAALADGDRVRQEAIRERVDDLNEHALLDGFESSVAGQAIAETVTFPPTAPSADPIVEAYKAERFIDVIAGFLANPSAAHVELVIAAVLDSGAEDDAAPVLEAVRDLDAGEGLALNRRARRDLEELERLVRNACPDWLAWSERLAGTESWADATGVARDNSEAWTPVGSLDAVQVSALCEALITASGGTNAGHLRSSLDLLCAQATGVLSRGVVNDFCDVVLMLLSAEENFSEMVRSAYLDLFAAWLEVGPSSDDYGAVLDQTLNIWHRIASPVAVAWALSVLDCAIESSCPDQAARTEFAVRLIVSVRQYSSRLCLRERIELESLAGELDIPVVEIQAEEAERDIWSALNGRLVGVYSLLPRATTYLQGRLAQLCSVREVRGNADEVATRALRALAERADYFIVDTWHATHAATVAIDDVRPRDRQVLPRQRGSTGLLRALEASLEA